MKVLAVDDDTSIRMLLKTALTPLDDYNLTVACSAKEGLKMIDCAHSTFDCFLIDIQMPNVDGIDLTKMIRQMPEYANKPILMLTAMHNKAYLDRAFMAGATDYVSKPFNFRDLYSRIFDAQKLTLEKARIVEQIDNERNIKWSHGVAKDTEPDQVIGRAHADGLIAYGEFDNYVLELARCPKRKATVIALKMTTLIRGQAKISLNEFSAMLREVTLCISASLDDHLVSISYRGNGTFLCVIEKQPSVPKEMIENEINARFLATSTSTDSSKMRVFVGDAIPLKANSDTGVLDILWSAIDTLERRVNQKKIKTITISNSLLNRSLLSEEQHRLERKAYKSVFKDILPEVDNSSWLQKLQYRSKTPS